MHLFLYDVLILWWLCCKDAISHDNYRKKFFFVLYQSSFVYVLSDLQYLWEWLGKNPYKIIMTIIIIFKLLVIICMAYVFCFCFLRKEICLIYYIWVMPLAATWKKQHQHPSHSCQYNNKHFFCFEKDMLSFHLHPSSDS